MLRGSYKLLKNATVTTFSWVKGAPQLLVRKKKEEPLKIKIDQETKAVPPDIASPIEYEIETHLNYYETAPLRERINYIAFFLTHYEKMSDKDKIKFLEFFYLRFKNKPEPYEKEILYFIQENFKEITHFVIKNFKLFRLDAQEIIIDDMLVALKSRALSKEHPETKKIILAFLSDMRDQLQTDQKEKLKRYCPETKSSKPSRIKNHSTQTIKDLLSPPNEIMLGKQDEKNPSNIAIEKKPEVTTVENNVKEPAPAIIAPRRRATI